LREGFTGYVASAGIQELREAIAQYVSDYTGADVKPEETIVTPSTKNAIYQAITAFAGPGDEVIVPDPGFPAYEIIVRHAGAKPVFLPILEEKRFRMTPEAVEGLVTKKTKMIVMNSPHNPTGGMNTRRDVEGILEIAREKGIIVISDEVYDHYLYQDGFYSALSDPDWRDFIVYLNGVSKTYCMTGWRIGYIVAREQVIERLKNFAVNLYSCPPSFNQKGALAALTGPQAFFDDILEEFRRRCVFITEALNSLPGFKVLKPAGTFYIFPNVKEALRRINLTTEQLAVRIMEEKGVVTLPGYPAFPAKAGNGYLRLSFTLPIEKMKKGIERIRESLEELGVT
jgi:aspartate aminotransferase